MGWIEGVRRQFSLPLSKRNLEGDVDEEVTFHLASRVRDLMRQGYSEERAREEALREFGDVDAARAELTEIDRRRARKARQSDVLSDFRQDMRFAVRALRRRPGFAAAAVLMLALGVGATTAIFSVVDSALLRPLSFEDPGRLAVIWGVAGPDRDTRGASYPEVRDWEGMTRSFSDMSIYDETSLIVTGSGETERLEAEIVSPGFFRLLGVTPQLGRGLLPRDDVPGATPAVVISHGLWQRRFDGSRAVLGRTITLDDRSSVIVGVMPQGFGGFSFDTEIWATLLPFEPGAADDRGSRWLAAIGRLGAGVSEEAAQADLWRAAEQLADRYPETNTDRSTDLFSLDRYYLDSTQTLLFVLLGAVGFVLLIACMNVMNLQLVRGIARGGEVAVRYALGARRWRLVRQLTTEAAVLATIGGVAGVALAYWGTESLLALVPAGVLPAYADIAINGRVLVFAAGVIALTGVVSGIVPALRNTRRGLADQIRTPNHGGSGIGARRGGLQRLLVTVEVALAVALMAGAALMVRSLTEQLDIWPGFQPKGVLAARVSLTEAYTSEARIRFAQQLIDRLEGSADVASVGIGWDAPLRGGSSASYLFVEGQPDERVRYYNHVVTPEYFEALGIGLIRGRGFEASDGFDAPNVVIVSEAFAEKLWPGRNPVGLHIEIFDPDDPDDRATVIGVAENVRFRSLTTDLMDPGEDPDVYFHYAQIPTSSFDILVRSTTSGLVDIGIVRAAVAELDPSVLVARVQSLEDVLAAQTAGARFGSLVLGIFAALALALSGIGLYGVMAFLVASRRREIAIRIALGAQPARVRRMVVSQGMLLVGIGAAAGLAAVLLGGRLFSSLLFGVRPSDPASMAAVTAILIATAALANIAPVRRAVRTEPQTVLRGE